jgi:lysophospholipase L1-like esterase
MKLLTVCLCVTSAWGQILNVIVGNAPAPPLPVTSAIVGDWDPDGCTDTAAISTLADSASTPHNMTATTTARPTCVAGIANGHSVARFDGVANKMASSGFNPSAPTTVFLVIQNFSGSAGISALFDSTSLYSTIAIQENGYPQYPPNSAPCLTTLSTGVVHCFNLVEMYAGTAWVPVNGGGVQFPGGPANLIVAHFDSSSSTLEVNRNGPVTANPGTRTMTSCCQVGSRSGANFAAMDLVRLIVTNSTLTAGDKTKIEDYLIFRYGIRDRRRVLADGDSITAGYGLTTPVTQNWVAQFAAANPTYSTVNFGIVSTTAAQILSQFASSEAHQSSGLAYRNIYWLWAGTNDIIGGATDTDVETTVIAIAAAAHAAGFRVGLSNIVARSSFSTGQEAYRQAFNTWTRANWTTYFDAFSDVGGDANIGCLTTPANCYNSSYFQADHIHLSASGAALAAALNGAAIVGM